MGIEIPDLNETEEWKGGAALSKGKHPLVVSEADDTQQSSGGHPQLILFLEAFGGPEQGGTIRDFIVITPNTLGKVKQVMIAFGVPIPEGDFVLNAVDFVGKEAWGLVAPGEREKENGGFWEEVKAYAAIDAESAAKEMQQAFAGSTVEPGGGHESAPDDDKDIPF